MSRRGRTFARPSEHDPRPERPRARDFESEALDPEPLRAVEVSRWTGDTETIRCIQSYRRESSRIRSPGRRTRLGRYPGRDGSSILGIVL